MDNVTQSQLRVSAAGMISRRHAAQVLDVTPKTMCVWGSNGIGPKPVHVGARVFYYWDEVAAFARGET